MIIIDQSILKLDFQYKSLLHKFNTWSSCSLLLLVSHHTFHLPYIPYTSWECGVVSASQMASRLAEISRRLETIYILCLPLKLIVSCSFHGEREKERVLARAGGMFVFISNGAGSRPMPWAALDLGNQARNTQAQLNRWQLQSPNWKLRLELPRTFSTFAPTPFPTPLLTYSPYVCIIIAEPTRRSGRSATWTTTMTS